MAEELGKEVQKVLAGKMKAGWQDDGQEGRKAKGRTELG
jgi:hypothetical protein